MIECAACAFMQQEACVVHRMRDCRSLHRRFGRRIHARRDSAGNRVVFTAKRLVLHVVNHRTPKHVSITTTTCSHNNIGRKYALKETWHATSRVVRLGVYL